MSTPIPRPAPVMNHTFFSDMTHSQTRFARRRETLSIRLMPVPPWTRLRGTGAGMEEYDVNEETHNPTVPIGFDIAWSVFMLLWIVLTVTAVVSIVRSDADPVAKIGWSALSVILPIVGPAAWFFASRRRQNAL
ncbi:hypothetical protein CJ178_28130 [Rhodococcus sp. ACPA4]|nr:hypothetical protein CJ178_28130 [Rhodococcus sp. ACPA4]